MIAFFDNLSYCVCLCAGYLDILMVVSLCGLLMAGYPAAISLAGTALMFALIGFFMGVFDLSFIQEPYPIRIFGIMQNSVLIAVPLFILMGVILERAKIAEDLLENMARLFGHMNGGLGVSVTIVGALLAASTGVVGATVVTMGLLSLPTMLRRGYDARFSAGTIAAAGTLGQIIPPSIILILLGDVIANAYQEAQLSMDIFTPRTVSVGDLFAGALLPGLGLVGAYIVYQLGVALTSPHKAPAIPRMADEEYHTIVVQALKSLPAPLALIIIVLGSILGGLATPTEAAAIGAIGAAMIAALKRAPATGFFNRPLLLLGLLSSLALLLLRGFADLRLGRADTPASDIVLIGMAILLSIILAGSIVAAFRHLFTARLMRPIVQTTTSVSTMVFTILIGAALFSLVFRGLGGEQTIAQALSYAPGGAMGAVLCVMCVMFVLGFFLDSIEITLVVVPLVAPTLLTLGVDPVWLGVMMAVNLQTSFITPPFGFALFYLRSVAPDSVKTLQIYRGALPYVVIQILMLGALMAIPAIATWLPGVLAPE